MSGAPVHAFTEQPIRHKLHVNGLDLVVYEWPGAGDPILLIHATGFHARCWQAVVESLPGRHVFALDMPSHGASARKPPPYEWTHFGADVLGVVAALRLERLLGVGHSMGGHALVLAAAAQPALFRGLILVDPVIVDPDFARGMRRVSAAEHPISRRRNRWESPEQMFESFRRKEPYARWDARVLMDYCRYGLVPAADGEGFELACPPDLEAEVYATMKMDDVLPALARVTMPVEVIRARSRRPDESPFDFSPSPTWERLASLLPDAVDEQLPDCSHFIPMERPRWMAERIARADARLGGATTG